MVPSSLVVGMITGGCEEEGGRETRVGGSRKTRTRDRRVSGDPSPYLHKPTLPPTFTIGNISMAPFLLSQEFNKTSC